MKFQVQLTITSKTKTGSIVRQLPTFVLPELLGLQTTAGARKVVDDMFTTPKVFCDTEIHGTIWDYNKYYHHF